MYQQYEELQKSSSRSFDVIDASQGTSVSTTYRSAMSPRTVTVLRSGPTGLCTSNTSAKMRQSFISTGFNGAAGPGLSALVNAAGVPLRGGSTGVTTACTMAVGVNASGFNAARLNAASLFASGGSLANLFGGSNIITPGACALIAAEANATRLREKHDLVILNDKFATYIEKVRFLEAHNRKLQMELEFLRSRVGQGSSHIKEMYDLEIAAANKLIEESKRDHANANKKVLEAEEILKREKVRHGNISVSRVADQKEVDALKLRIAENEAQIALYRRRIADIEDEVQLYKKEGQSITAEIYCVQNELQNELLLKSSCECEKIALDDALANLKQTHEAELMRIRSNVVSTDLDPSIFFRNELALAIREIRKEYEATIANQRGELQSHYSIIINEIVFRNQPTNANIIVTEEYRRDVEKIRSNLMEVQNQNSYLLVKNQQIQNAIADLQRNTKALRESNSLTTTRIESEITEARSYLARIEENYAKVIAFKASLDNEIATYRKYLESADGLRGYVDRIEQAAQLKLVGQSSSSSSALYVNRGQDTDIQQRTYINTSGSNYSYGASRRNANLSNLADQSAARSSPTQSHSISTVSASKPVESPRGSLYQESLGRSGAYKSQNITTQESTKRSSLVRDGASLSSLHENLTQNLGTQGSSQHPSLVRDGASSSSLHENLTQNYGTQGSSQHASLVRDGALSSSSHENLTQNYGTQGSSQHASLVRDGALSSSSHENLTRNLGTQGSSQHPSLVRDGASSTSSHENLTQNYGTQGSSQHPSLVRDGASSSSLHENLTRNLGTQGSSQHPSLVRDGASSSSLHENLTRNLGTQGSSQHPSLVRDGASSTSSHENLTQNYGTQGSSQHPSLVRDGASSSSLHENLTRNLGTQGSSQHPSLVRDGASSTSSHENLTRNYGTQGSSQHPSLVRDGASSTSSHENLTRNYGTQGSSQHPSLVRDGASSSSLHENLTRNFGTQGSSQRASSVRDGASSTASHENLTRNYGTQGSSQHPSLVRDGASSTSSHENLTRNFGTQGSSQHPGLVRDRVSSSSSSSQENLTRNLGTQGSSQHPSLVRDRVSSSSSSHENLTRNLGTQGSSQHASLVRDRVSSSSSSHENLTRDLGTQGSSQHASLVRDGASPSHESVSYEISFEDNLRDDDDDTIEND
ncbi:unnamed protein product [Rotaria sordida]|uniref:IF rod domain-containing protein n=1 Tax=Rotaria sordida TaxID=392033 RepID=A0A814N8J2_9BILA|nr:unnamed protein product [Rotaria sordida]